MHHQCISGILANIYLSFVGKFTYLYFVFLFITELFFFTVLQISPASNRHNKWCEGGGKNTLHPSVYSYAATSAEEVLVCSKS